MPWTDNSYSSLILSFLCGQWLSSKELPLALSIVSPFLELVLSGCRSLLAVTIGILLFLLTSFSDMGNVSAENVSWYLSDYPYDNTICRKKECLTCKLPMFIVLVSYLLVPSIAAYAINVLPALVIIVGISFVAFIGLVLAGRLKELKVVYILTDSYVVKETMKLESDVLIYPKQSCLDRTSTREDFAMLIIKLLDKPGN
ncbi:hypothetical protein J1N35_009627 [Gossypium stocksii]|uniref:Uncharacterized protein n=1 Tax=Gossypium stocksii TaxID=47602 RepID=A0A9D3VYP4_9ROSI|nr:hypothetical protein J1N35_009627 [Gossypium stocksii]